MNTCSTFVPSAGFAAPTNVRFLHRPSHSCRSGFGQLRSKADLPQSCRLVRNPSTYNGGHGRWGRSGSKLTNPSLYRSLLPDCPTVVVVRVDHAAAAPGREGARSVAPRQRVRPLLLEAVFH